MQAKVFGKHRFTDIQADEHHFLAQDSQREGEVGSDIGLTFSVDAGSHQNDGRLDFSRNHEAQVCTQLTEQLCRDSLLCLVNSDVRTTRVFYDLSRKGSIHPILVVFWVMQLIVHQFFQIKQGSGYAHAQYQAYQGKHFQARLCREGIHFRSVYHAHGRRGGCQHQRILFTLLIQIEIQLFFQYLLTLYLHILTLLRGHILNTRVELGVALQQSVPCNGEALANRTNACDNVLTHTEQLVVQLLHNRVLVSCRTKDAHTLQQHLVVLADERGEGVVLYAQVSRQEAESLGFILQELFYIVYQV